MDAYTYLYNCEFWWAYTSFCRELAPSEELGRGKGIRAIRELDRALWQYSKENQ